jgi:hypothetical protein
MTHKQRLEALLVQLEQLGNPYMAASVREAIKNLDDKPTNNSKSE